MLQKDIVVQDRYRVMGTLGSGPTGNVYLVEAVRQPDRRLALKEIGLGAADAARLQRFETEAAVLVSLRHRNLPVVHDFFVERAAAYLVMDFVPGRTLWDVLSSQPAAPPWPTALGWLHQIGDALQFLHERPQPVVFREVEPANCVLQPDGVLKMVSFGLGRLFSTPEPNPFSAPEEQGDGSLDPRSDIYAFGATAYVVGSRHLPPEGWERLATPSRVPPVPGILPSVLAVIDHMMAIPPEARYGTVAEARRALEAASFSPPEQSPATGTPPRPVPQLRWRPTAARPAETPAAPPAEEEEDEDEVTSLQKYLADVMADYEKYVSNIGQNHLAAPMLLYYRDEVQDTLEALNQLGVNTQDAYRKVSMLDLKVKGQARTVVNEVGYHNFKQYWIMNDPPKERWWWYLSRNVTPPLPDKRPWEFWK